MKLGIKYPNLISKVVVVNPLGFSDVVPPLYKLISFYPVAKTFSETIMKPTMQSVWMFLESAFYDVGNIEQKFANYMLQNLLQGILLTEHHSLS